MNVLTVAGLLARIPPAWASAAASAASPLAAVLSPQRRLAWEENVDASAAARPSGFFAARKPFYHHLLLLYESLAMLGGRRFRIVVEGEEHLREALARRCGLLVATAHVGNWHIGARLLHERTGRPVHSVAGIQMSRAWTGGLRLAYRRHGIRVHPIRGATRRFVRVLRGGGVVGLHIDGNLHAGAGPATRGIVLLARRSGVPILPGVCERTAPGELTARFWPLLEGGSSAREVTRLDDLLLDFVRGRAEQWSLFRPLWGAR